MSWLNNLREGDVVVVGVELAAFKPQYQAQVVDMSNDQRIIVQPAQGAPRLHFRRDNGKRISTSDHRRLYPEVQYQAIRPVQVD